MGQHSPLRLIFCFVLVLFTVAIFAQNVDMSNGSVNTCGGFFYDSGGSGGTYGEDESLTFTICSDNSTGTNIRLSFSSIDIGEGETIAFYDSDTVDPAAQLSNVFLETPNDPFIMQASAANTSGCLTIVFTSDNMDEGNLGWGAAIECVPNCQIINSLLQSSTPTVMPIDTGYIDICPGDRVILSGTGFYPQDGLIYNHSDANCTFEWDFGDNTTASGPNVSHVFNEPGGYVIQLTITDEFGCTNTNFLNQRVRVATYPSFSFVGDMDETICSGDTIMVTSSVDVTAGTNITTTPNQGSFAPPNVVSDTIPIPDGAGGFYESTISINQFNPGAVVTTPADIISVDLNLEHSYVGDLDIELICPDGTDIFILNYPNGTASTNFGEPFASGPVDGQSNCLTTGIPYTYVFTMGAANGTLGDFDALAPTYTYTTVPSDCFNPAPGTTYTYTDTYFPAGEYAPDEGYNNLIGCPLNGSWTIRVTDNLGADNGWLTGWAIRFQDYLYADIETFTPQFVDWGWDNNPTVLVSDPTNVLASPENAGDAAYTFWVLDEFGCRFDTTLNFSV
ncbi:MAG: PKD domain-containing protein, partial [Bacteroidota bacterium]